jgi:hypothetical protein
VSASAVAPATLRPSRRIYGSGSRRLLQAGVALGALAVLAACTTPGYGNYSPTAGRAATAAEAAAISTAVHSSPLTTKAGQRSFQVIGIRISRVTPTYAFATIDPASATLDGAAVALHRATTTATTWRVTEVGSAQVGCSDPSQVRIEFALSC